MSGPLFQILEKKAGTTQKARDAISDVAYRLGISLAGSTDEDLAGLALCARGESVEVISKYLTWKDFEALCSDILRAKGYRVRENIILRNPRAQVDVLGVSGRIALAVDCKHWKRSSGHSALANLVEAQKARAKRLHESLDAMGPIVSVILVLVDPGERFVSGGAVVPIFALEDFADGAESYLDFLDPV